MKAVSRLVCVSRSSSTALAVFEIDSTPPPITSGNSGTASTLCPRAITSGVTADAASADATAYRRWFVLMRWCHLRHCLVGPNMRPERHMLPNAPCPERCVPPPATRGMRETARPVPHDSAEVWWPAFLFTAYG